MLRHIFDKYWSVSTVFLFDSQEVNVCPLKDRLTWNQMVNDDTAVNDTLVAGVISVFTLKPPLSPSSVLPSVVGVAVAKRSSKNTFIGNLQGRRSCHGHMYSPAGWLLPYRHILSLEHNSSSSCDPNQGTVLNPSFNFTSSLPVLLLWEYHVASLLCVLTHCPAEVCRFMCS